MLHTPEAEARSAAALAVADESDSAHEDSVCITPNNRSLAGRRRPSVTWVGDDDPGLALPLMSPDSHEAVSTGARLARFAVLLF